MRVSNLWQEEFGGSAHANTALRAHRATHTVH